MSSFKKKNEKPKPTTLYEIAAYTKLDKEYERRQKPKLLQKRKQELYDKYGENFMTTRMLKFQSEENEAKKKPKHLGEIDSSDHYFKNLISEDLVNPGFFLPKSAFNSTYTSQKTLSKLTKKSQSRKKFDNKKSKSRSKVLITKTSKTSLGLKTPLAKDGDKKPSPTFKDSYKKFTFAKKSRITSARTNLSLNSQNTAMTTRSKSKVKKMSNFKKVKKDIINT
jgi:hypothetical protein